MSPPPADPGAHVMQCMDIWGGNREIDTSVTMQGLDARLLCRPYVRDQAAERVGGDIHYLTSCATGRITRMLLADVSGHGEAVAEAARSLRTLLGRYANYIDQTRFIEAVNRRFGDISGSGPGLFATAVVATYFSPSDELTVCSAGHPPALHYLAAEGTWRVVRDARADDGPSNLPLGVLDDTPYRQTTMTLGERDMVLLYTDALSEAANPTGEQLGVGGLARLLDGLEPEPEGLIDRLIARVAEYRGEGDASAAFDDDVSALLITRNTRKPSPSVGLGLTAGWRIARNAGSSVMRGVHPSMPELSVRAILGAFAPGANARRERHPE